MSVVVRVTDICLLLRTWVVTVVPLMITTEEPTNSLPLRVSRNPACT